MLCRSVFGSSQMPKSGSQPDLDMAVIEASLRKIVIGFFRQAEAGDLEMSRLPNFDLAMAGYRLAFFPPSHHRRAPRKPRCGVSLPPGPPRTF